MNPTDFARLEPEPGDRASLRFDEARASAFAKGVAGDFNPLHDPGDRRFCVPGDLLFAVLLHHYGLHRETSIGFASMVDAKATLALPPLPDGGGAVHVLDARGREVLAFFATGERVRATAFARALALECVRFSGLTFPDILMPLMRARDVMVNPDRPLIIYKDMAVRIDAGAGLDDVAAPVLRHGAHEFAVNGRKGIARLRFEIVTGPGADGSPGGRRLGEGEKNFVLGGLREHDRDAVDSLVARYAERRSAWVDAAGDDPGVDPVSRPDPARADA